ncbi:MAG TPA: APC family permease [Baekduia sp.]|nr:APC family permease [Baekduia sp.]
MASSAGARKPFKRTPSSAPLEDTELKRAISSKMLLLFVIGDVLGAGIYALVGVVGGRVGGAIWMAFAAALILALITAFAYSELVTKYPRAAGAALYVNKAFGIHFVTFIVTFAVMASGVASAATLSRSFGGDYLADFVDLPTIGVAIAFLLLVAVINARGIAESVKLNVVLTTIELCGLVLVAVIGLAFLADGGGETSRAFEIKEGEALIPAVIAGAGLAFYALIGFEDSVNVAEETQKPRDYPLALFGGILIAGAIYLVVTIVASMAVPTDKLAGSDGPLLEVVQLGPLAIDTKIFSAIALFALANGALINMIMSSRLLYGMGRADVLPSAFSKLLPSRKTPWVAILFTTAIAAILVATGDLSDLADMTVLLLLGVFTLVNLSVLVLRRDPVEHDHFKTPIVFPIIGAGVSIAVMFTKDGEVFARAGLLLLGGVVLWAVNYAYVHFRSGEPRPLGPKA